ncbi:MAG TPA: hypothetical protein VMF29_08135, partial [Candidatus Edwardsbacteria bacterium]|nr:hypothetical protein [Candidatus Edwardsbacteria bacterium]
MMTTNDPLSEQPLPAVNLVHDRGLPGVYDIELAGIPALRTQDSLDCHLVIYPYSRTVTAKHVTAMPFEEYVEDIISRHRSVYERIEDRGKYLFGFALTLALAAVFLVWQPVALLSLESIASLFGVYFVGKELWDDIEAALQRVSQ